MVQNQNEYNNKMLPRVIIKGCSIYNHYITNLCCFSYVANTENEIIKPTNFPSPLASMTTLIKLK